MISIRQLEEHDKEMYLEARKQEPGCEKLFAEEKYIDLVWNLTVHGNPNTYAIMVDDVFIGYISIDNDEIPEIGLSLLPEYQGKGYGGQACRLLIKQVYNEKGITKVSFRTEPTNVYCIKMLDKLGAKKAESRPSILMEKMKGLTLDDFGKSSGLDDMKEFNDSVLRYDLIYTE